jgi:AGCS family alanine or glycine:cation symporter
MYALERGLKMKWLAVLFCVFTAIAAFGIENTVQANAISTLLAEPGLFGAGFDGIPTWITGAVLAVVVALVIVFGVKGIANVCTALVPFMAIFYVGCSIVALIVNAAKIPAAFGLIFREAFNFRAAAGGAAGYGIMVALQYGFSRGVFSNEAGLGSAPIAHAASSTKDPVKQGLWGMFEVFFTTIIICTLSALVILTTGIWESGKVNGSALSIASFDAILPGVGGVIVTLATVFFALSTILGWAYYGEVSAEYLSGNSKTAVIIYRCVYVAFVFLGAVGSFDLIWSISDTMNGLMAIPNLIGIIGLSKVIKETTKNHFKQLK